MLRMLAVRREEGLRELALDVEEASEALREELFSRSDVKNVLEGLGGRLGSTFRRELEHCAYSAGVALRLFAEEAQSALGAELAAPGLHHRLEEPGLLREVAALEEQALALPASDFAALGVAEVPPGDHGGADRELADDTELMSLREEVGRLQAQLVVAHEERGELERLQEDHKRLEAELCSRSRVEGGEMRLALTRAEEAASALREELAAAERHLEAERERRGRAEREIERFSSRHSPEAPPPAAAGEERALKTRVAELEAEVGARLAGSKQFQQLRSMLSSKSQDVVRLRQRLREYEPETVPDGDA